MEKKDIYLENSPEGFCVDWNLELSDYCEVISMKLHERYAGTRCIIIDVADSGWDLPCEIIWVKEIKCELEDPNGSGGRLNLIIDSEEGKKYEYNFLDVYITPYECYDDMFDEWIGEEPEQITSHCSHLA